MWFSKSVRSAIRIWFASVRCCAALVREAWALV